MGRESEGCERSEKVGIERGREWIVREERECRAKARGVRGARK